MILTLYSFILIETKVCYQKKCQTSLTLTLIINLYTSSIFVPVSPTSLILSYTYIERESNNSIKLKLEQSFIEIIIYAKQDRFSQSLIYEKVLFLMYI